MNPVNPAAAYFAVVDAYLKANPVVPVAAYIEADALSKRAAEQVQHSSSQRVPLGTSVRLATGVYGVISGHSTQSSKRYRVTWWSRHFWAARHVWCNDSQFEVVG